MSFMFQGSKFNGDISDWSRPSQTDDEDVFLDSSMAKSVGDRSPSLNQVKSHFLNKKLEAALKEAQAKLSKTSKVRL